MPLSLSDIAQTLNTKFPGAIAEQKPDFLVFKKENLLDAAKFLKEGELSFENLHCVTGVDLKDRMEVIYHLYSFKQHFMLTFKVVLPYADLTVETLSLIWKSANWMERETYDFYGIKFLHHPDHRRILNPDEWTDFPLRKDFKRADFVKKPETLGLKGAG